ncbi:MAG: hypothetical protein KAT17_02450 [Candidatus Aminicenantes bacterium]|nr:hypothetical protein [Candidatus Aminicenantes bacterium]
MSKERLKFGQKWFIYFLGVLSIFSFSIGMPGQESLDEIKSPVLNMYYHIQDDTGTTPTKDTEVLLLFEPGGKVLIYVYNNTDELTRYGNWSYTGGKLWLKISAGDLKIDSDFELDLNLKRVKMPFRIFSVGNGSSDWRCQRIEVEQAVRFIFGAATSNQPALKKKDAAISRAMDFARAVIAEADKVRQRTLMLAQNCNLYFKRRGEALQDDWWHPAEWWFNIPSSVKALRNGIEFTYIDGSKAVVVLFSWASKSLNPIQLKLSRLVRDPRVHINVEPSGEVSFDPRNKTVLFIAPFHFPRSAVWQDRAGIRRVNMVQPITEDPYNWSQLKSKLSKRGYEYDKLTHDRVTVEGLLKKFSWLTDPGIVIFYTHGTSSGSLCTGEMLGINLNHNQRQKKIEAVKDRLKASGHSRLIEDYKNSLGMMSIGLQDRVPAGQAWFVTVRPSFWRYLQEKRGLTISFKRTLFYAAACLTDHTPDLRNAVKSRAYFGWKATISPQLNGTVCQYLLNQLCRPTRSAEEAYYNLIRVVNTREMIYKEDRILRGVVPATVGQAQVAIFGNLKNYLFNGYGFKGNKMISYTGNGWLSPKILHVGQVWWLVFAGRWGNSAKVGSDKLWKCYRGYWSKKKFGRMKELFCNAANIGKIPKRAEVAYAGYLLTGKSPEGYSGKVVPRWTLNESKR